MNRLRVFNRGSHFFSSAGSDSRVGCLRSSTQPRAVRLCGMLRGVCVCISVVVRLVTP